VARKGANVPRMEIEQRQQQTYEQQMLWHAQRQTSALNAIKVAVWILAGLAILGVLAALTAVF
jgi:hypothetical protein